METANFGSSDLLFFSDFAILTTTYKAVHGPEITTSILCPKTLSQLFEQTESTTNGPSRLCYHAGGLVSGQNIFAPLFNSWYLKLSPEHSAIVVPPSVGLPSWRGWL
ncbi:hypothetical protein BDV23DRAFT_180252 [Aspergillus alliaceus]|uniref:Uncharacterized protein n=1 Tax=Petromyces alliaceus TaxID=209559 RepID=A0A5N7CHY6_PETAA|nr:hypothetical protein BDV23DRAFT_180252 [Aspergillus alliaceus]